MQPVPPDMTKRSLTCIQFATTKKCLSLDVVKKYSEIAGIERMSDISAFSPKGYLSTGSLKLDLAICQKNGGIGLATPTIVEVYGPPGLGKTTLALELTRSVIRVGGLPVYVDAEGRLWADYAAALGVDVRRVLAIRDTTLMESIFSRCELALREFSLEYPDRPFLVIVDSLAKLTTTSFEKEEGKKSDSELDRIRTKYDRVSYMGQAKKIKQCLRMFWGEARNANACLVLLNHQHITAKGRRYTTGGKFVEFMSSVRLSINLREKRNKIIRGGKHVGHINLVRVDKNTTDNPFEVVEYDLMFGTGIRESTDVYDVAKEMGIIFHITKAKKIKGGDYYNETRLGGNRLNSAIWLEANAEVLYEIREAVIKKATS